MAGQKLLHVLDGKSHGKYIQTVGITAGVSGAAVSK